MVVNVVGDARPVGHPGVGQVDGVHQRGGEGGYGEIGAGIPPAGDAFRFQRRAPGSPDAVAYLRQARRV